jgi:amidohydrolase
MYKDRINKIAASIKEELIDIRRDIHANPECGLKEFRTSSLVAKKLTELGLEVQTEVGVTGVVGLLRGKNPGKTILLRADMDCLVMDELNELEFKSKNPGLMHACGHDGHITWLLGAATILSQFKEELNGNVKFIFQPAEESLGGADRMIKAGVLENPKVDAAIGAHVWPTTESGKIAIKYGPMMAAPDKFIIKIIGKGGHGAMPQNCIDPIAIGWQIYSALQTILTRKVDPLEPVLLSVCRFEAGSAFNVIPDSAEMEGTVRTLTHETRQFMEKIIEDTVKAICLANEAFYEFEYVPYYPPVINHASMTAFVEKVSSDYLGKDNIDKLEKAFMIGEDFSYFQKEIPAVFFGVGTYNKEKGITKGLHSPYFNIDEDILPLAASLFSAIALEYLNEGTLK